MRRMVLTMGLASTLLIMLLSACVGGGTESVTDVTRSSDQSAYTEGSSFPIGETLPIGKTSRSTACVSTTSSGLKGGTTSAPVVVWEDVISDPALIFPPDPTASTARPNTISTSNPSETIVVSSGTTTTAARPIVQDMDMDGWIDNYYRP